MMKNQEMIFIHKPGADNMTLAERIDHIRLHGEVRSVLVLTIDKSTIPTGAIIAWYEDINNPLNQQISGQQA